MRDDLPLWRKMIFPGLLMLLGLIGLIMEWWNG